MSLVLAGPLRAQEAPDGRAARHVHRAPAFATAGSVASAQRWARSRQGTVAFAVLDGQGRIRGWHRGVRFPSASVVKAMLLVAALRQAGKHHLGPGEEHVLRSMITFSDNDAATRTYREVGGGPALRAVAAAAGMRRFVDVGRWPDAQITAADQVRLFLRIDRLVPLTHRKLARALLSSIIVGQRWGIATVARERGFRAFFKGGWRSGIEHQAALLVAPDGRRLAVAVLTSGSPSSAYGRATEEGIARRVLRAHR